MTRITYEKIEEISSILILLDNVKHWNNISPYQNVEYIKMALRRRRIYSLIRFTRPFFIKFYINNELALIMPLSKSVINQKYFIYGDRSGFGYLDILHNYNLSFDDIKACFDLLVSEFPKSIFYFNRIKENSIIFRILNEISTPKDREECVKIKINKNFEQYYNSLSKSVRQNFRTANNRLLKSSKQFLFKRIKGKDISKNALNQIICLYLARLRSYKKSLIPLDDIFYRYFDLGFVSLNELEFSEVFLIYIDDKLAAFMLCLVNEEEILVPRLAIDDSFSFYSPGVLLVISAINELFNEEKIKSLDLMQGIENYKFLMGGEVHMCYSFEFSKKSLQMTPRI